MKLRWFRRPTLAARVSRPHPVLWAIAALVLLLAAALIAVGGLSTVGVSIAGRTITVGSGSVADVAAAVFALAAITPLRRSLYARLARRPGPLEISSFVGDPPADAEYRRLDLLAEFRRTLAEMSLSAPEPVPSEPSAKGVVDDVRTAFDGNRSPFVTALLLVVSLLRVRHAYRVSVQVLSSVDGRCGLSVHVARLPSGRGEVETVWEDDWRAAAQRAAHVVGAYLVPRSRLSRRAPWLAWHGIEMPTELFHQSQLAARWVRERRYERALDALHRALKEDPQNPYLRIDLGQVQEQAGLHLDAVATYADVIAVESWFDGRLWRRLRRLLGDNTTGAPPARVTSTRNGRDALLIARYRICSRLGTAEQLQDQWMRPPQRRNGRRHADREALKFRLRVWLNSYARIYELDDPWVPRPEPFAPTDDRVGAYEASKERLIHLVQTVGRHEAEALADDYRWSRGRRTPGLAINQTAVQLLRLAAVLHERQARSAIERRAIPNWWPIEPGRLDTRIGRRLYLKPGFARSWKEYYNAACITAIALPGFTDEADSAAKNDMTAATILAFQGVRHLERAVSSTDSGYVSRYAQWLSTGDQDLNPLRNTPQFVDFLDRYFPNQGPRVLRPQSQLVKLVMSMHTSRLLMSFCDRRAQFWCSHINDPTERGVADELLLEAPVTSLVADYVEHDRHWQTRVALLREADEFCCRWGLDAVEDVFPTFQEDPKVLAAADDPGKLKRLNENADVYFKDEVISVRSGTLDTLLPITRQRAAELRRVDAEPAPCRDFWLDVARRLRVGLGIPEQEHRGVAERRKRTLPVTSSDAAVSPRFGAVTTRSGE